MTQLCDKCKRELDPSDEGGVSNDGEIICGDCLRDLEDEGI